MYEPFYSLLNAAAATTGLAADISSSIEDAVMQIVITQTATVKIEGSSDGVNWQNVSNPSNGYTAGTLVVLDRRVPYYRARVSSYTNGQVTAMVGHGRSHHGLIVHFKQKAASNS